jgi:hypothetical protein
MIVKRLGAVGALFGLAAMLGACSPFAGYMADHVPHWAGGLPADAPPRPGAPGYDEFIAHGETAPNAQGPESGAAPGAAPTSGATGAIPAGSAAAAPVPQFQARNSKSQPSKAQSSRTHAAQAAAQHQPAAKAPAEPVETPSAEDPSVVKGGLY